MTFTTGLTYRHRNNTEVDMQVITIHCVEPEYVKMSIVWINRHHKAIFHDSVTVKTKDMKNWSVV